MAKLKALITGRYSPEVEAISEDAPSATLKGNR